MQIAAAVSAALLGKECVEVSLSRTLNPAPEMVQGYRLKSTLQSLFTLCVEASAIKRI